MQIVVGPHINISHLYVDITVTCRRTSNNFDCSKIAKSAKSLHIVETHLSRTAQSLAEHRRDTGRRVTGRETGRRETGRQTGRRETGRGHRQQRQGDRETGDMQADGKQEDGNRQGDTETWRMKIGRRETERRET